MNLLPVSQVAREDGRIAIRSDDVEETALPVAATGASDQRQLVLGIRPQHLRLSAPGDGQLRGTVEIVEHLGDQTIVNMRMPSGATALATLQGEVKVKHAEKLGMSFDPDQAHIFSSTGPSLRGAAAAMS